MESIKAIHKKLKTFQHFYIKIRKEYIADGTSSKTN